MMQRHIFEISWESLWRVLFFILLVALGFASYQILLGLFLAVVISAGLDFFVDFLEGQGVPRTLGVILIFLIAILAIVLIVYTVVPFIIVDLNAIVSKINRTTANYWLGPLVRFEATKSISLIITRISGQLFTGDFSTLTAVSGFIGGFGLGAAVLVSSFYLSINRDGIERFIRAVFPLYYEDMALRIYERSRRKIGGWVRSQLLLSLIMGFLAWVSLWALGVSHAFLLGLITAVFELVPFVGPIISGAIAVIAGVSTSPISGLYVVLIFLALHQFESNVLVPLLTKRSVGLHPVIVITSLLIGIELAGFLGGVIAVPAAAVLQEVIEDWAVVRRRGVDAV